MGARSLRIMAFGHEADPGGSHAPAPSYAEPTTGPSVRHNVPAGARPAPRLQTQGHRPDPLGRPADRRRGCYLDPRRRSAARRARAGRLPKAWRRRPQRLAIDLTLIPYHGEPFRDPEEVYRGLAKEGTSH